MKMAAIMLRYHLTLYIFLFYIFLHSILHVILKQPFEVGNTALLFFNEQKYIYKVFEE